MVANVFSWFVKSACRSKIESFNAPALLMFNELGHGELDEHLKDCEMAIDENCLCVEVVASPRDC